MKVKLLTLALLGGISVSNASDNFWSSFSEGESSLSFRYRFENVDQDGFDRDANASTLRTRLNYKTKDYKGFSFFVEADNVTEIFTDNYNAGAGNSPGNTHYPVVADPQGTELNQAWINYNFNDNNSFKLGRQRINLDNQRFIGGVGWRQNEQTYDAVTANLGFGKSKLFLGYVDNVNRIFGDDVDAGDHDNSTFLANWSSPIQDLGKISVYYYDIDNKDASAFSTSTFGVKFNGNMEQFGYGLEYANQSDAHNNLVDFTANYMRFDGSYQFEKVNLFAGFEALEGDSNQAGAMFRTPLATLHAFNGWADKFLGTPNDGLEDLFIGVKGNHNSYKWQAIYHDFRAEDSSLDYGNELDLAVGKKMSKHFSLLLKAAFYNADEFATDTNKFWFMVSADF